MKTLFCSLAAFGFIFSTLAFSATELAKINGRPLSLEEFNKKYQENLKFYQFKAPTKENVLDDLIKRELGIQEAAKMGLDKDPEVVDRMNTVLYQALLEKKLAKRFEDIKISNDQAESYYRNNPEIRTSHIFVAVPPGAAKEQEDLAYKKIKEIQEQQLKPAKMSFSEVAQRFSEGMAAPMGGDLDYQNRDRLDPVYYETSMKLSQGGVSSIVRSQFGYHIIKLTGKKAWKDVDKAKIKQLAFDEKRRKIFDEYMSELRKKATVVVNKNLLK